MTFFWGQSVGLSKIPPNILGNKCFRQGGWPGGLTRGRARGVPLWRKKIRQTVFAQLPNNSCIFSKQCFVLDTFCILNVLDFWQGGKPTEGQILSSVAQWNFFIFYISYTYWRSICKVLLFCGGSIAFDNCISQGRVWKSDDGHELSCGSPFFLG